jgi:hypothetical protein
MDFAASKIIVIAAGDSGSRPGVGGEFPPAAGFCSIGLALILTYLPNIFPKKSGPLPRARSHTLKRIDPLNINIAAILQRL